MASEMDIKYEDMLNMTWKEYNYYNMGFIRRLERKWDLTRNIMTSVYNASGMVKKKIKPDDIIVLNHINKNKKTIDITDNRIDEDRLQKIIEQRNGNKLNSNRH